MWRHPIKKCHCNWPRVHLSLLPTKKKGGGYLCNEFFPKTIHISSFVSDPAGEDSKILEMFTIIFVAT